MAIRQQVLLGATLDDGRFRHPGGEPWYVFQDARDERSHMCINDVAASRHVLLLGGSGTGKTNVMNLMFRQARKLSVAGDASYIVFDTKADYVTHRGFLRGGDELVGNNRRFRDMSAVWNVFAEVLVDGRDARDIRSNAHEIARTLFEGRGSKTQPFFANAASDIFANALVYLTRRAQERPSTGAKQLNNANLVRFLDKGPNTLSKAFNTYDDMQGLTTYFGDGTNDQGMGVLSELRSMLRDCFQGVFASSPPAGSDGLSVRRLVRRRGGRALFVEYDLSLGLSLQPVYRLLFDLALKEALGSNARGHTIVYLDELRLLPQIHHLEDALNFGRSKGVSVVAGLQSVEQLDATYGSEEGRPLLGGFGSIIAFGSVDPKTMSYVSDRFGANLISYRYPDLNGQPIDRERESSVVEPWRVRFLGLGEAIVGLATQPDPFLFRFRKEGS